MMMGRLKWSTKIVYTANSECVLVDLLSENAILCTCERQMEVPHLLCVRKTFPTKETTSVVRGTCVETTREIHDRDPVNSYLHVTLLLRAFICGMCCMGRKNTVNS